MFAFRYDKGLYYVSQREKKGQKWGAGGDVESLCLKQKEDTNLPTLFDYIFV